MRAVNAAKSKKVCDGKRLRHQVNRRPGNGVNSFKCLTLVLTSRNTSLSSAHFGLGKILGKRNGRQCLPVSY